MNPCHVSILLLAIGTHIDIFFAIGSKLILYQNLILNLLRIEGDDINGDDANCHVYNGQPQNWTSSSSSSFWNKQWATIPCVPLKRFNRIY